MTFRLRFLIPMLVLAVALSVALLAAPSIARAESLYWGAKATFTGPGDIPAVGTGDPTPVAAGFNAVCFADAQVGWAVGVRIDDPAIGTRRPLVVVTSDAGASATWSLLPSIDGTGTLELNGVHALSTSDVVVVGSAGFIGRYNGSSWTQKPMPGWGTKAFRAVSFAEDALNGWAVGDGLGVARTVDGGSTWTIVTPPGTGATLRAVVALTSTTAIAVGDGGAMRLISGSVVSLKSSPTSSNLYGIAFADDALHGWAVGDNATCIATSDGGTSWVPGSVGIPSGLTAFDIGLRSVAFAGRLNGVIVGKYQWTWRTIDGGATWRRSWIDDGGLGDYELRGVALAGASGNVPVAVGRGVALQLSSSNYKARAYQGTWDQTPPPPDTTKPVTTWPGWAPVFVSRAAITLMADDFDDGSGVAETWWRFDGGTPREGTVLSTTKAGAHTLEFWSVDKAGNEESPHITKNFTVLTATKLSITSNRTSVLRRHAVTLSGIITPNVYAGTHIEVWVLRPGSHAYTRLTTRYSYAYHHWSYTYYPATKGTWYFKVKLPQTARYASSESTYRRITVK
ncbi:MAG TPA: YCF48-related protein [Coriobacteriia bacterium]